jgi:hypothetical protein
MATATKSRSKSRKSRSTTTEFDPRCYDVVIRTKDGKVPPKRTEAEAANIAKLIDWFGPDYIDHRDWSTRRERALESVSKYNAAAARLGWKSKAVVETNLAVLKMEKVAHGLNKQLAKLKECCGVECRVLAVGMDPWEDPALYFYHGNDKGQKVATSEEVFDLARAAVQHAADVARKALSLLEKFSGWKAKPQFTPPLRMSVRYAGKSTVTSFVDPRIAVCEKINTVPGVSAVPMAIGGAE